MSIFERRPRLVLMGLLAAALAAAGCIKDMDRREVDRSKVVHMSFLFSHEEHKSVIKERGLGCLSCHPEKTALKDVIPTGGVSRKYTCHDCHRNPEMAAHAPQRCVVCHTDLKPSTPADHQLDWLHRHSVFAQIDDFKCASCHEKSTCTNCHLQRDSIQQTVHPRTFQYYHSIEARGNPHACGSCHQVSFCRDCHTRKGISF
jgi:hypothetical protein